MPDEIVSTQLLDLSNKVNDIRTDVAVIKVQTSPIKDHERRLRSLEASRSRIWGWWTAAAVFGAGVGWVLSVVLRIKG